MPLGSFKTGHFVRFTTAEIIDHRRDALTKANPGKDIREQQVSISRSDAPRQMVYGTTRVGGVFAFATTIANALHLVIVVAAHEVSAIETLYLDGEAVKFGVGDLSVAGTSERSRAWANKIYWSRMLGHDQQAADPNLLLAAQEEFPELWTSEHRLRGCAYVYLRLLSDPVAFPNGVPEVSFLVKGRPLYEPTAGVQWHVDNAALVIADYLKNDRLGLGVRHDLIDQEALQQAVDVCDELVQTPTGLRRRYTINGAWSCDETPSTILAEMARCIGGDIVYQAGKWRILPGAYRAPAITLNEDDFRGPVTMQTHERRTDAVNVIKGTFVDASQLYAETEFPPARVPRYVSEDGEEMVRSVRYTAVTNALDANRLASLELERSRQGITVSATFSLRAYQAQVGDVVRLSFARYGWVGKEFEVRSISLVWSDGEGLLVQAVLRETSALVYDWLGDYPFDRAPNTILPDPWTQGPPTNVKVSASTADLYVRGDGTVQTRVRVTWDPPTIDFAGSGGSYDIDARPSGPVASKWYSQARVPGHADEFFLLDAQDRVHYDVRIRAVSALGVMSSWVEVTGTLVEGKSAAPSNVSGFAAELDRFGLLLTWAPVEDADLSHYELRTGPSWDLGVFLAEIKGTSYRIATGLGPTVTYQLKAVDTSKNVSIDAATITVGAVIAGAPSVSWTLDGTDAVLSWTEPVSPLAISSYEIRYGTADGDYESATVATSVTALTYRTAARWVGTRRWYVSAMDVHGNRGAPGSVDALLQGPGPMTSITADVVDNNVLLRWTPGKAGTLPIATTRVYRGASFERATLVGEEAGTFAVVFELTGGRYRYWVVAVDTAGNLGEESSIQVEVNEPPDFVLRSAGTFDPRRALFLENVFIPGVGYVTTTRPPIIVPTEPTIGEPLGLLLALTHSDGTEPPPPTPTMAFGESLGLLLSITHSDGSAVEPPSSPTSVPFVLVDPVVSASVKANINDAKYATPRTKVINDANAVNGDSRFGGANWTVTTKSSVEYAPMPTDKRYYYSIGLYFWPDDSKANKLPWINTDVRNDSTHVNRIEMSGLISSIETLGLAYFASGNESYATKAINYLTTFFLDPVKGMYPNLRYGQGVPGLKEGRAEGTVDLEEIIVIFDAMQFLSSSPSWTTTFDTNIKEWFRQFADWYTTSNLGIYASKRQNNILLSYELQLIAYLMFTGETAKAKTRAEAIKTKVINEQIDGASGSLPAEMSRSDPWGYTIYAMEFFCRLALQGERLGVDIWNHVGPSGQSLKKACEFVKKYADPAGPSTLPNGKAIASNKKINAFRIMRYAALAYNDSSFEAIVTAFGSSLDNNRIHLLHPKRH